MDDSSLFYPGFRIQETLSKYRSPVSEVREYGEEAHAARAKFIAPPPCSLEQGRAEIAFTLFVFCARHFSLKGKDNFSARQCRLAARRRGKRLKFSVSSAKVSSSGLKKIHQNFTFRFLAEEFLGGAKRRP
jgi:hypothetical protein